MIKLISLKELIISLIGRNLGKAQITFEVYSGELSSVLSCNSEKFKFNIVKVENGIRVFVNGDVYLTPDVIPENYIREIDLLLTTEADKLKNYYKLNTLKKKVNDVDVKVYEFVNILN